MLLHFMELQSFATRFFQEAMIHSDASVDFTGDGSFLVTLVPSNLPMTTVVGVSGMSKATRGQVCDSDFQGIQLMKIIQLIKKHKNHRESKKRETVIFVTFKEAFLADRKSEKRPCYF